MSKKIKLMTVGATAAFSVATGASIAVGTSTLLNNKENINISSTTQSDLSQQYPLHKAQSNGQNSFLSTKDGPLVYWKDTITALDWFGGERWHIDTSKLLGFTTTGGDWNRAWYNWDYDRTRNILWVLGYGFAKKQNQKIYAIDANDGTVKHTYTMPGETDYRFITALSSGNAMVYGGAKTGSYNGVAYLIDSKSGNVRKLTGDSGNGDRIPSFDSGKSKMYLFNIFSIGENKNIVEYVNYDIRSGITGDDGFKNASYNVYFALVDDNLNMLAQNSSDTWYKGVEVVQGVKGFRNTSITPQRDYYFLLDGRVVTILYNTVVIINPKDRNANQGVSFQKYTLDKEKWVLSWTFDNEENLFFKYKDDSKIYKVNASELQRISGTSSIDVPRITYYDLNSSSEEIKKHANNYVLYNVYGYSGQIMLINAWYSDYIRNPDTPDDNKATQEEYGLAVAITQNKGKPDSGDSKGCLNGSKSFQRAATFFVNPESLKTKLPSEITRNDITITNEGFFTNNKTLKEDNKTLKYPPFQLKDINDKKGTFKVVANIDQIPWFTSTLPKDATPKTIEMDYTQDSNKAKDITTKTSWKGEDALSYDFKNMLPSDVLVSDLNDFDPFQVSFNSRTVIDSSGRQEYPKKTYSVASKDDVAGTVTINVNYDYMPVSNEVNTVQHYSAQHTYNIFKQNEDKELYFAGSSKKASETTNNTININEVPQLKSLSQSNLLPSSFNPNDKNSFLQFINTNKSKGYPISRMNFQVQANDNEGSLIITSTIKGETFRQKYVGFNKVVDYKFSFNSNNQIDGKQFSSMLPSSVNEGDIIDNLISYNGFNSSDFKVTLFPNDETGSLTVKIELNRDYASNLGNNYGFNDYVIQKEFSGFMNTQQYNNKYNITFRENGDEKLVDIKKETLSTIKTAIEKQQNIVIGTTRYTNLNDLVEKLFINTKGTNIPTGWSNNDKIITNLAINNQAGTMNISISIDKSLLGDYGSNLNYVISYTGFANGNIVETEDNLSFVDQSLLKTVVPEIRNMKPSEMAKWLQTKANLLRVVFSYTGQYVDFFGKDEYELITETNDVYGTISITIKFKGTLTNSQSLLEYSTQYNLYK